MSAVVVVQVEELVSLVRDAVAEALEDRPPAVEGLLDRQGAANYLGVTSRTLDTLRKSSGLPWRRVGDSVRFSRAELDAWTKEAAGYRSRRSQNGSSTKPAESDAVASGKGSAEKAAPVPTAKSQRFSTDTRRAS